jgi:peptidoglycan/xylan/chitin deacetylase (PgdA/CDA1 family)
LTIEQIKKIKNDEGWEIGFHTNTHTNLNKLNDAKLKKEIIEGKRNLEKKLGFKIRYFAYPMGEYSDKVINIVKKAGFEAAFTTDGGAFSLKNEKDRFTIDRVCLEGRLSFNQFKALLSSVGLYLTNAFVRAIKIKSKLNLSL